MWVAAGMASLLDSLPRRNMLIMLPDMGTLLILPLVAWINPKFCDAIEV